MNNNVHVELDHDFIGTTFSIRGSKHDLRYLISAINSVCEGDGELGSHLRFYEILKELQKVDKAMSTMEHRE